MPQWQMKTPILGGWPLTSSSSGYSFFFTKVPRTEDSNSPTLAEAALAWVTVSGISLGEEAAPQTNIPSFDVLMGVKVRVLKKPYLSSSTPSFSANSLLPLAGLMPTVRTTRLNSSCMSFPSSDSYFILRFRVSGTSSTEETLHLTNLTPYSFFALSMYLSKSFP